jgi:hypothetical protein
MKALIIGSNGRIRAKCGQMLKELGVRPVLQEIKLRNNTTILKHQFRVIIIAESSFLSNGLIDTLLAKQDKDCVIIVTVIKMPSKPDSRVKYAKLPLTIGALKPMITSAWQ